MSFAHLPKMFIAAVFVMAVTVSGASANDSTIPCNAPPDKGASVAVHAGTQVSTTQDKQEKTCTFSINGAVTTSPPAQQVINALNTFRGPTQQFLQDPEIAIPALATLLVAAAPVREVPTDVVQLLTKTRTSVSTCLDFFYGKRPSERSDRFSCKVFEPYTSPDLKAEMLRSTGTAVGVPTLALTLEWGDGRFVSTVWLPIILKGMPPLRTP